MGFRAYRFTFPSCSPTPPADQCLAAVQRKWVDAGRQKMLNALRALIEARFGPLPADDLSALVRLALKELEQMTPIAGTATSYAAVRERLHKTNNAGQDQ